jgi:hypothetical protein
VDLAPEHGHDLEPVPIPAAEPNLPEGDLGTPPRCVPVETLTERPAMREPPLLSLRLPSEIALPSSVADADSSMTDDGQRPGETIGEIRGRVTDADTGEPVEGAAVHLDLPDGDPLVVITGSGGRFLLAVPPLPRFVALSAVAQGYIPATASVPAWRLRRGSVEQDFELERETVDVIVIEPVPQVYHLGNDRWEGRINSQFQKRAQGRALQAFIELPRKRLHPPIQRTSVWMLAKGVQCPHRVYVNGKLLRDRLRESPADGSFGEFGARFDPELLIEGTNVLEIHGVRCQGDVDDFELVNIQLRLSR